MIKERYPDVTAAITLGYWFTTAPQVHNGVIYIGSSRSESHIPGGHLLAVNAKTGRVLWHFNTIPQDGRDQGWDLAGPTWVGGERNGGGIWETPSIDPELGLIYVAVGNPFGDSSKRIGTNLFTDSILALSLSTGALKWHYQQVHHDVWDYDSGNQPILFDMQVRGRRVKALAEASKNGYLYILDRETGKPVHPIKEMPVPTETARPGEQPWPTQPIPYTAAGEPMKPVSPVFPIDVPAERLAVSKPVPQFTPPGPNQIYSPGTEGGANYGPLSYSPRTGLLYVDAVDSPLGARRPARGYFSAFDPSTGELAWQQTFDGWGQAGSVVTAGGLVFVGTGSNTAGYLFAYDAKTGALLVEVQHRRRRLLVAGGVHGERRGVRHGGVGRRRARPPRRRSDSRLCPAETRPVIAHPSLNRATETQRHGAETRRPPRRVGICSVRSGLCVSVSLWLVVSLTC